MAEETRIVGQLLRTWPFRPVGEGLVPSRPATAERGRAAGDKPPPYRNDGTTNGHIHDK